MKESEFDYNEWKVGLALGRLVIEGKNPFVLKYYSANMNDETNLQNLIDQKKDLPSPILRVILKQLFEGLRLMHEMGLIHRDLKGENIMLHSPPGSGRVFLKIADFGLTKIQKNNQQSTLMTVAGTLPFMCPELLIETSDEQGSEDQVKADSKIDMWSAGILLHQLTAHTFPFKSTQLPSITSFMINKTLTRPAVLIDNQLWDLLRGLLAFNRKVRLSAVDALNHQYFTGQQAMTDILEESKLLAQQSQIVKQQGKQYVTLYDLNTSFIFPITEADKIINKNIEQFQLQIISCLYNHILQQFLRKK
ncbi:MAG: putative CAMK/CAMK1 protein kinase [Streblomastix strix]|uniref:Putative CAMK/CAMK1 protein kinase n=1 Tax=Streblomastix strix TaxID=222440 RepID=A0A5J4W3M7_9EUKA|nr:MAG: putative CAMK/CAMK1 protein kinase [Streblomastix strix]